MKNKEFLEEKNSAEPTEKVTVTLSGTHKTFKTESGDYRLERYKDNKIKAFKDDEVSRNTKNVLRAINKEYKLGYTSDDFKKIHTRKLGKEIIEKMKDSAKELEMSIEPPGEERKATHAAEVEAPTGTLFSEEEVKEVTEAKVKKEDDEEDEEDEVEEVVREIINKEEFLLSIPDSISLIDALSDVALIFTKVSFIYRKRSQGDLKKYICFHKELKWGVYKHEDRYFLVNIGHPKKTLGIESKATLLKVTEVLTDADDDSYLEKASIKGNNVLTKTSDSEKLFLQTITEYDLKQQAFKAEELVTQIKAERKAEEERRRVERKEEEVSEEEVEEVAEAKVKKEDDEKDEVEEVAKPSIPKTKGSLLLLFVSWTPLAYVLYGSDTGGGLFSGEPLYNGWVVAFLIFLGYFFTMVIQGSNISLGSKVIFAIFSATHIVVPYAVISTYWGWSPAAWSGWNIAGVLMWALLSLGCLSITNTTRKDAEEAKRKGVSIKVLHEEREAAAAAEAAAEAAEEKERAKKRAAAEKAQAAADAETKREFEENRRILVKKYGEAVVAAFLQKRVCLDMPVAMVTKLKGEPDDVKREVTKKGEKLQYRYTGHPAEVNRLGNIIYETKIDLVNGVVTGFKDL